MDLVMKELAEKCGLKMSRQSGAVIFRDEGGATYRARTHREAAGILYDEIFTGGKYEGKKQAVIEICDHARLL